MDRKKSISNWKTSSLLLAPSGLNLTNNAVLRLLGTMPSNWTTYIKILAAAQTVVILLTSCLPAQADIYRYEDADGIIHFTDAPTDKKFKVFMRDIKKDAQLRTRLQLSSRVNPAEYENIIKSCSEKYGVSVPLIKAVIHAESGYNPNAVSVKGASGLMQLMPATAKSLKVNDRFNPNDNVEGGVKYLRFLLDTFRGDVSLALAAYNAGLTKVAKFGGIPPYKETQTYVSRVLSYMQSYQAN